MSKDHCGSHHFVVPDALSSPAAVTPEPAIRNSRSDSLSFPYYSQDPSSGACAQNQVSSLDSLPSDLSRSFTSAPNLSFGHTQATLHQHEIGANLGLGSDARHASPTGLSYDTAGMNDDVDEFGLTTPVTAEGNDADGKRVDDGEGSVPAWTELKTKAGKERRRLPLACMACRRKKIRCSGEKPACKHCFRTRIPCVYKIASRSATPRTDYMTMLDERMEGMEEKVIKFVPKNNLNSSPTVIKACVKHEVPGGIPIRSAAVMKRAADEAFLAEMDSWSKSTLKSSALRPPSLLKQEVESTQLFLEGTAHLPPEYLQEHLCEIFFENVYGQAYHLLHKPTFMRKLKAGTVPPVLLLSICAVSARFSTHPKVNTTPLFLRGEEWASEARNIVLKRYDSPSVTVLICLLILALHEFGTCRGGRSWSLGGMAIRMAYALQLHRDLGHDPLMCQNDSRELSSIDREIRRRAMWACFFMDRFMSSGTDRPSFIKEDTIKISLPVKERLFRLDMPGPTEDLNGNVLSSITTPDDQAIDAKQNMGVAAFIVRSIALWGRIINYWNLGGYEKDSYPMWHQDSIATDLQDQIIAQQVGLPDFLKYSTENIQAHEVEGLANQFLFLHIIMQQNILFMNKFSIHGVSGHKMDQMPTEYVMQAGHIAYAAADRMSEILCEGEAYFVSAPFAGYCAFLSSTIHIFGIFSGNLTVATASKLHLATNLRYLNRMKQYWGMFYYMIENLKDQYRICSDAASGKGGATSPTKIFQYGDWFDRYPNGINLGEFHDHITLRKEPPSGAAANVQSSSTGSERALQSPQHDGHPKKPKQKSRTRASTHQQSGLPQDSASTVPLPQSLHLQIPDPVRTDIGQLSPSQPMSLYHHHPTTMYGYVPPQHQGLLHQLDRQLVFGAYGTSPVDPTLQAQQIVVPIPQAWGMHMSNTPSYTIEPSSAWFMPFNMEPPEVNHRVQENDVHNSLDDSGSGHMIYHTGSMPGIQDGYGIDHYEGRHQ